MGKLRLRVAIVGATGETGHTITNGLLEATHHEYEVTALARPSSVDKPEYTKLRERGIKVVGVDLKGPQEDLVKILSSKDIVIAALPVEALEDQIPLARAAKCAGIKRFVPSAYATVVPPQGVVDVQDMKEAVYNEIKMLHLPYTIIDVGWWYSGFIPHLPSGRTDYARPSGRGTDENVIPGDGNAKCCMIDWRDIGRFVARIIADPRTLNRMVLANTEVLSPNQLYDIMDELSGEKAERTYMSAEQINSSVDNFRQLIKEGRNDYTTKLGLYWMQYLYSFGIRGDNTPEYAVYLGYLKASNLYPDMKTIKYREFFQEALIGKARRPYAS